jgi:hypothetical protein
VFYFSSPFHPSLVFCSVKAYTPRLSKQKGLIWPNQPQVIDVAVQLTVACSCTLLGCAILGGSGGPDASDDVGSWEVKRLLHGLVLQHRALAPSLAAGQPRIRLHGACLLQYYETMAKATGMLPVICTARASATSLKGCSGSKMAAVQNSCHSS